MLFGGYPCFFSFSSLTLACQRPTTKAQVKVSASNASSRLKRSESFKCVSSRLKPRDFNAPNKDSMPQRFLYCSWGFSQNLEFGSLRDYVIEVWRAQFQAAQNVVVEIFVQQQAHGG